MSDAGRATALVVGLMSHRIIASSYALCVYVYVCKTAPSVVISGSVGFSRLTQPARWPAEQRPTNPFLRAIRHRSKKRGKESDLQAQNALKILKEI